MSAPPSRFLDRTRANLATRGHRHADVPAVRHPTRRSSNVAHGRYTPQLGLKAGGMKIGLYALV